MMSDIEQTLDEFVKVLATYPSGKIRAGWICRLLDALAAATGESSDHEACLRAIRTHIEAQLAEDYLVILDPLPGSSATPADIPSLPRPFPLPPKLPWFDGS